MDSSPANLSQLLLRAASHPSEKGIRVYQRGSHGDAAENSSVRWTYKQLFQYAKLNSRAIRHRLARSKPDSVVILHFDNQFENILWFWSVVIAGYIPCISQPLNNDLRQRRAYFLHLDQLFDHPLFLTSSAHVPDFLDLTELLLQPVENLVLGDGNIQSETPGLIKSRNDIAAFMLTSGSSGNPKGVIHLHGQILESIKGKAEHHRVVHGQTFLNWIGLDHDANLTETHLQAMWLVCEQIHVHRDDVTSALQEGPQLFLKLLSEHKVSHTFAPNAYLDAIRMFLTKRPAHAPPLNLDLSSLRNWISGGERNVVASVAALTRILQKYGAPDNIVRPGFGMTETCAGSIYSRDCPRIDIVHGYEHANLGSCIRGIKMRIMTDDEKPVLNNVSGNLEVTGPVVTQGYFNNPEANAESFTEDGWFKTGDIALIDSNGHLVMTGRAKDDIIINGIHHHPNDLHMALEEAMIPGISSNYALVFAHLPKGAPTEVICIVYVPTYDMDTDVKSRVETLDAISKVIVTQTATRPYRVIPLPSELLQKTSLGKLPSKKIAKAFEDGDYNNYIDEKIVRDFRNLSYTAPSNEMERNILDVFKTYEPPEDNFGIDTNLFQIGVDSVGFIQIHAQLEAALRLGYPIKMSDILANPTPRLLAAKVSVSPDLRYNPHVILQSQGTKTPLWLIHPGMGEVLIFMQLARYFSDDRPVYALRPRGLDGDELFVDIPEAANLYYEAIIKAQPHGPYAILGYSFGGSMAFEVGKLIEQNGGKIRFLGVIDQPPQLRENSRRADWYGCLIALSSFLGLLADEDRLTIGSKMRIPQLSRAKAVGMIIQQTMQERLDEFQMTSQKLERWATVAYRLKEMGRDYDPIGFVDTMDVFYTVFRTYRAKSDDNWLNNHLGEWKGHVRGEAKFHFCEGTHYDMISTHVVSFQRKLKALLAERGL